MERIWFEATLEGFTNEFLQHFYRTPLQLVLQLKLLSKTASKAYIFSCLFVL